MGKKNNYDDWFVFSYENQGFMQESTQILPDRREIISSVIPVPGNLKGRNMEILCRQCGQCCSSMGEILRIIEQTGRYEYRIEFLPTGIRQIVRIDPDKQRLFSHAMKPEKRSLACPFLRIRDDYRVICTIHQTRPDMCRMYFCETQKGQAPLKDDPVTRSPE